MNTRLIQRYSILANETNCRKWLKAGICVAVLLLLALTAVLFSSCEKKELCYLEHEHVCHTTLTMNFNTAWDNTPIYSNYTRAVTDKGARYIAEFWSVDENGELAELIERKEVKSSTWQEGDNTQTLSVDLPAEKIAVLCWAEPLAEGKSANAHFDASALKQVKMLEPFGLDETKDAFCASTLWDFTEHQAINQQHSAINIEETLTLLRPFGSYTVISNDVEEYYTEQGATAPAPVSTQVNYNLWIPPTYNVFRQIASGSLSGATYTHPVSVRTEGKEYTLAEELIFIGPNDGATGFYNFYLSTYTGDGTMIHESGNVELQVQRNKHTLVYGAFLTDRKTNTPGIDDSFDDVIEVVIPD